MIDVFVKSDLYETPEGTWTFTAIIFIGDVASGTRGTGASPEDCHQQIRNAVEQISDDVIAEEILVDRWHSDA